MEMVKKLTFVSFILIPLFSFSQNVGIGVVSPTEGLSVAKGLNIDDNNQNPGLSLLNGLKFGNTATPAQMVGISSNRMGASSPFSLDFYTSNTRRMIILQNGFVGINAVPSLYFLEVGGTIRGSTLRSAGNVIAEGGSVTASGSVNANTSVNAGTNVTADGDITAANNITSTTGDIVATSGELRAGGRGVLMSNSATRQKVVAFTVTMNANSLSSGGSATGNYAIAAGTFTATPTAYVGNVVTEVGDYFKAMVVLENVTSTNVTVRIVNVTANPITFTGAQWKILVIGSY